MLTILGNKPRFCLLLVAFLAAAVFLSCADDDPTLTQFSQELVVEILAGPQDGTQLLNNEFFTFEWRARGGGGDVTYEVQLSGGDSQPVSTDETSRTYAGQAEGSYTFTVTASSGSETALDSRNFTVGPNLGPPNIILSGARGSASSGGTGVRPVYAPGQSAFVNWQGSDIDRFGEIVGYRWRTSDSEPFNEFNLGNVAGFTVPTMPAVYTFTLEAQDNVGATAVVTLDYEVKDPTIIIVDDKVQPNPVDERDEDLFYASLFEGFAFANWDVADRGTPATADLTPFEVAVIYSGGGSAIWSDIGTNYPDSPVQLSEFVDAGGKLWVMGQGILEDIALGTAHDNPPATDEFESVYLHLAPATGDSAIDAGLAWERAGDFSGDLKFSFADEVIGDPANFPRITIDVQSGDVEHIVPDGNSEIIYSGRGGLGTVVGNVALRFPSGGVDTEVVFMTFPLFESSAVKASLNNSRTLTQQIMREMGQ